MYQLFASPLAGQLEFCTWVNTEPTPLASIMLAMEEMKEGRPM